MVKEGAPLWNSMHQLHKLYLFQKRVLNMSPLLVQQSSGSAFRYLGNQHGAQGQSEGELLSDENCQVTRVLYRKVPFHWHGLTLQQTGATFCKGLPASMHVPRTGTVSKAALWRQPPLTWGSNMNKPHL